MLQLLLVVAVAAQPVSPVSHAVYLGGGERVEDIAVDGQGNVYLTGSTGAGDFAGGAKVIGETGGRADVFVVKLNPTLTNVLYAVKVGGSGFDLGIDLHVDDLGAVYVVGFTNSTDLPVTEGVFQPATVFVGGSFLLKLAPEGDRLEFLSYVNVSAIRRVSVDPDGKIWVAGTTNHNIQFPFTRDALRSVFDNDTCLTGRTGTPFPCVDGFLLRLTPDARTVEYGSLLGSRGSDSIDAIAFGPNGDVYVGGLTTSQDFPANVARFSEQADNAFVLRLDPTGSRVLNAWKVGKGTGAVRVLLVRPSGELLIYGDSGPVTGVGSASGVSLSARESFIQGIAPDTGTQTRLDFFPVVEGITMAADGSIFLTSRRSLDGEERMSNVAYCLSRAWIRWER